MHKTLYDPFSLEVREDPYPIYRELRAHSPVYHNPEHELWVLSRFDDVQAAARDWKTFTSTEGVALDNTDRLFGTGETGNFIVSDPPLHTRMRGLVKKLFTPKTIKETYTPPVEGEVRRLLDRLEASDSPDLARDFAGRLPAAVVAAWLGFPPGDVEKIADLSARSVAREVGNPTMPDSAVPAFEEFGSYVTELVSRRRSEPSDDVTSRVLKAARENGFGEREADEIAYNTAFFFYLAGTETTAALIGNALLALDERPDQRRLLLENPGLRPQAVEEFIRYDPPLQHVMRTAAEGCEVRGVGIPARARVMFLLGSANRDEDRWERSEELDLAREPKRHIGFGEGIHHCLGAPLARLEAPIALSEFLRRWPEYEVSGPVERLPGFSVRGPSRLPARLR
jgi:cytochrome P450